MFDGGVVRLDFRGGGAGDDEDFDFVAPAAHGAPEPGRLGLGGVFDEFLKLVLRGGGVFEGAGAQQRAELLFDVPCRLQLAGRVIEVEDVPEPVTAPA